MKNKLIIPLLFVLLAVMVVADPTPFNQCITVLDIENGGYESGLNCTLYDYSNYYYMFVSGNNYCYQVNSSRADGNYDFIATCTDGVENRSVFGEFEVGDSPKAYPPGGTKTIIEKATCGEGLILEGDLCVKPEEVKENIFVWLINWFGNFKFTGSFFIIICGIGLILLIILLLWYVFKDKKKENRYKRDNFGMLLNVTKGVMIIGGLVLLLKGILGVNLVTYLFRGIDGCELGVYIILFVSALIQVVNLKNIDDNLSKWAVVLLFIGLGILLINHLKSFDVIEWFIGSTEWLIRGSYGLFGVGTLILLWRELQ